MYGALLISYERMCVDMRLIDMHCDTIWKLMDLDKSGNLMENQCGISFQYTKQAKNCAIVPARFIPGILTPH